MKSWVEEMFGTNFYVDTYRYRVDDPGVVQKGVEGAVRLLGLPKGSHILDWCGGYGRFAIPMARLGYKVTLLDLSSIHTEIAQREASENGVELEVITSDFRETPAEIQADGAINVFTSGIGYLSEDDDLTALRSLYRALKPGAPFILETIFPGVIFRNFKPIMMEVSPDGRVRRVADEKFFDFRTGRVETRERVYIGGELKGDFRSSLRIYQPNELKLLLEQSGFSVVSILGSLDGEPLTFESRRMVFLSIRQ